LPCHCLSCLRFFCSYSAKASMTGGMRLPVKVFSTNPMFRLWTEHRARTILRRKKRI
jgi:hypothetical protein